MEKTQAITLIEKLFDNAFDEKIFIQFCTNLLNDFDTAKATTVQSGNYVYEPYRNHIKSYKRVGQYTDPDGEIVDILTVKVHDGYKLERTRTGLRNFAIEYLKRKEDRDTLLIAFHSDDCSDWRFSYVKLDYKTVKDDKGRIKARQEATSAKRYSFLVGETEPCHTAKKQFLPLLTETDRNPTVQDIENCFNIEKVTKEFFEQYKTLYLNLLERLDNIVENDSVIRNDFAQKNINTSAFAKKLLGQIVFLYFIQKKGWLGVPKEKSFGNGDKRFLKSLFKKADTAKENYFNDYLEHLFYDALAVQRSTVDPSYYKKFDCRIPFLNGGLFEPMKDYDWKNTSLKIPNEIFSNTVVTKEGDVGTGILDVFDRYNFTVKEDEPLEKEVAVDPEMLGKVFENLLEVKDRKSKGAFYTPREIVHYMCQESLVNYLDTALNSDIASHEEIGRKQTDLFGNTLREGQLKMEFEHKDIKIPKADIDAFIKNSHLVVPDNRKEENSYSYQLPVSIKRHSRLFDSALAAIKVCDPAIGSGAFPVGMLNEIVKARSALTLYMDIKESDEDRTLYHLKRECIQNSLYGVDIDDSAIDVAKLRLWLSLVVDEESIQDIEPLPNLDYKIVCGNSLLGIPDGVMHNDGLEKEIEELKKEYFKQTDNKQKKNLKSAINEKFNEIIDSMRVYSNDVADISFDFKIHFSEIWHEKNGFDVVIGNPPYGLINKRQNKESSICFSQTELNLIKQNALYTPALGGMLNIFRLFIIKSISLLNKNGFFSEIFPLAFVADSSIKNLRKYILENNQIVSIDAFPERDNPLKRVFENAKMSVAILHLFKSKKIDDAFYLRINNDTYIDVASEKVWFTPKSIKLIDSENLTIPILDKKSLTLLEKIYSKSFKFSAIGHCYTGEADLTIFKDIISTDSRYSPLLRGAGVGRYKLNSKMSQGEFLYIEENKLLNILSENKKLHLQSDRIVLQGITGVNERTRLKMTIVEKGTYLANSVNYLFFESDYLNNNTILGFFNSSLHNFIFKCFSTNSNVNGYEIDRLPITKNENTYLFQKIDLLVSKLLKLKIDNEFNHYFEIDAEIDARVAHLYSLTEPEYQLILEGTEDTFRITALNYFRDIQKGILK